MASNVFTRSTWRATDTKTVIGILGDSIAGYYSYIDRAEGYFHKLLRYYRQRGFNIEAHDRSIDGGTSYDSAPTGYVKPAYVSGVRGIPNINRNVNALISLGCTDILWAMTNNDVLLGYIEPNPAGFNNETDEQYDILKEVKALCLLNNVTLHVFTQNSRQTDAAAVVKYKQITEDLQGTGEFSMFDNFLTLADPDNSYLGKAGYYKNDVHPNDVGNDAVFQALKDYINNFYGLVGTCPP